MFASFDNGSSSCHYSTDHYTMFRNDSIQDLSSIFVISPFTDHHQDGLLQQQEEQEELLLAQLAQQQLLTDTAATVGAADHNTPCNNTVSDADNKNDSPNGNKGATGTTASNKRSVKRSGKKDRHSKIATAQGIRDRRMRLSLEVAHRFFTLQDMLGFDKASKTVEWLLTKSKSAIRELGKGLSQRKHSCIGVTSTTEYDQVVSEIEEGQLAFCPKGKYSLEERKKTITSSNKPTFNHVLAKEYRAKARERARERTIEKMRSRGLDKTKQKNPQEGNFQNLKSLSSFGKRGSQTNIDMKSSMEALMTDGEEPIFHPDQVHQGPNIEDIVDESFVMTGYSNSPTSNFKNRHNVAMSNFTDNWATNVEKTAGNIRENILDSIFYTPTDRDVCFQTPFDADVQLYGKPWDLFDNQINPKID